MKSYRIELGHMTNMAHIDRWPWNLVWEKVKIINLKMEYCEILFDLENIFDILIRAASWQNISSLRINTNNDE